MSITDTSIDLLAHFLPTHCDARMVSHYLALLAENEVRLKEQLRQTRDELRQHAQAAEKISSPVHDPAPPQPVSSATLRQKLKISEASILQSLESDWSRPSISNKLYERGMRYFNGDDNHPVDLDEAISMFKQALEWDHPEAEVMLGECYYFSEDKTDYLEDALEWYNSAAQKGHPDALYSVGYLYYYGEGTKTNKKIAFDFLKKAVTAGSSDARKMLSELSCS